MVRRHNSRVNAVHINPDINEKNMKPHTSKSNRSSKKKKAPKSGCCLRNAHKSAVKLFRVVRAKISRAFWAISKRGSSNGSTSSVQQKFAPARDSHQSEYVEDCIIFMNSSSGKYE